MSAPAKGNDLALLALGFVAWAAGFSALYGGHAIGCEYGWQHLALGPTTLLRAALAVVLLASLATTAALAAWTLRRAARDRTMLPIAAAGTSLSAVAATAVTGAPVLALSLCH